MGGGWVGRGGKVEEGCKGDGGGEVGKCRAGPRRMLSLKEDV